MYNGKYLPALRYAQKATCGECKACSVNSCAPARDRLRNYNGIRFTSDGFDCALPVSIDSHTACSFGCQYCFSDNLAMHRTQTNKKLGQMNLQFLEDLFAGRGGERHAQFRKALKYDRRNEAGYPCAVQVGALTDPLDNIERQQGWFLEFVKLCIKYNQPARISTKGNLMLTDEYLDALRPAPHLFWVAFSIITPDDDLIVQIDKRAPNATERLKAMKRLSSIGVNTSLRFRPMYPNVSDNTPKHPKAYKELLEKAKEAGARAVSYECGFVAGRMTGALKQKWNEFEQTINLPLTDIYSRFGKSQACMRPSYIWTEDIMHAVYEEAHKLKMDVGVSDPAWKQLSDFGCCCGIPPDDKVFGNWERENATEALLNAKRTGKEMLLKDIVPPWAYDVKFSNMCNVGVGYRIKIKQKYWKWSDRLAEYWNAPKKERSPLMYFQGAVVPSGYDEDGNIKYKYRGLQRQNLHSPHWKV